MFLENEGFNKNIMIYFGEKFPWGIKKNKNKNKKLMNFLWKKFPKGIFIKIS